MWRDRKGLLSRHNGGELERRKSGGWTKQFFGQEQLTELMWRSQDTSDAVDRCEAHRNGDLLE